ncbi:DUF1648 domain-containing protein [Pseudobacteroides cellulosolvens]|uniref:DUF1648 domain-containing protein n=1 Tax=Pseudobacteroides cellulosolvens ATCC 35603 = DSM 2933 TaxID=398512 RepID=A0A0L6JUW5_9FIRM|nr:DUF1648 domain-containing protein [Pseudobacteroides cellulosolvens]KNY29445.1 protein of unknown function DUF1648 [Pseudobacteroides cellulosolvens ATCC 35603 = DSM 2933]
MKSSRPKLKIPLTIPEIIIEGICAMVFIGTAIFMMLKLNDLPEKIPTHFGICGRPDGWGGKGGLNALFIVNLALYTLLTILGRFPHIFNYLCEITEDNAKFQYTNSRTLIRFIKTEITVLFSYMLWVSVWVAEGKMEGVGVAFLPVVLIVLFGTVAFFTFRMIRGK